MANNKPMVGEVVLYRTDGRNGLTYDLPAIVTCTKDSHPGDYPDGSQNPLPVPESDLHVHLTVFTPGGFGTQIRKAEARYMDLDEPEKSEDFKNATAMEPGSGTYVEWNVPLEEQAPFSIHARTWRR